MQSHPGDLTIAIIGGGLSGTLAATQLLRQASSASRLRIKLIERQEKLGRGVAYGTREPRHLLNVRAINMSGLPDDPEHFVRWLQRPENLKRTSSATAELPECYAPRALYAEYIEQLFAGAKSSAASPIVFEQFCDEAVAVVPYERGYKIHLQDGASVRVDKIVLALGNFPPKDPPGIPEDVIAGTRYVRNPWSEQALAGLSGDEAVLLIGAGLTMVDLAVALHVRGHNGTIQVVSRRGRLPQVHQQAQPMKPILSEDAVPLTVRSLLRRIRLAARENNNDWRSVVNSLRPVTTALWKGLPLKERRRFLRHAQTYWDLHRHRMAPETAELVSRLQSTGLMTVRAGRIVTCLEDKDGVEISVRERWTSREVTFKVARIINCTGGSFDIRRMNHTLIGGLLDDGLVRPDELGLGLDVADGGRCIALGGNPSPGLYTIGPLCKGALWETTAVPEIREQAAVLARHLLSESA
jgi:uncharacterized NAD(P)/FAD-binding protein YdhS